jgi:flagellar biosynthesis protein FlhF
MYVRKFEAESLEDALKAIKKELGPDAIILKTVTNKGLKGAFKKKRIEITAAISEKSYTKKAKVDHVLTPDQQDKFYSNKASYISNMIDNHDNSQSPRTEVKNIGYGKAGLNKQVVSKKTKELSDSIKSSLDDFLGGLSGKTEAAQEVAPVRTQEIDIDDMSIEDINDAIIDSPIREEAYESSASVTSTEVVASDEALSDAYSKIDELEKKLYELTQNFERIEKTEPVGIYQLRNTLCSLDIAERSIQRIIKKASFDLSREDLEDTDTVFEFALREMVSSISVDMPLFSSTDATSQPVVTVLLSETSTGQSSMIQKIAALRENSVVVRNSDGAEKPSNFADKVFQIDVVQTGSISEIVSQCRKAVEAGKSVFIDYKVCGKESDETKKFVDGLRRSFDKVEVLVCLSSIHSELYNKKVANRYKSLADGSVVTNLDLCLNYGALYNISEEYPELPFKFYGTGEVIPDDLEAATAERILAGIFQF